MRFDRFAILRDVQWATAGREQVQEYRAVLSEPGALRAALNWYRAGTGLVTNPVAKPRQPTLYMWRNENGAFSRVGAEKTAEHVAGPYRFVELNAGHALTTEAPDAVSRAILSHLAG